MKGNRIAKRAGLGKGDQVKERRRVTLKSGGVTKRSAEKVCAESSAEDEISARWFSEDE